jgi:hypothetical protein
MRRALVERHHDVRIERALDFHRPLGGQQQPVAVDRRRELDAVLAHLAQRAEAEDLEAAGIRQDRPLPAGESMQAAVRRDDVGARAQPQMECVAEDDLRADVVELGGRHRLDGAVRTHRHEHGRLDDAVGERQACAPRSACAGEN